MTFRFCSVRDRNLSLWQSAVDEMTDKLRDSNPQLMAAMRQAAASHAKAEVSGAPLMAQVPSTTALSTNHPDALAFASKLFFDIANAHRAGDAAREAELRAYLTALVRDYSTLDLLGWFQCVAKYAEYYVLGAKPKYVDWKEQSPDDPAFGVLDYQLPANSKVLLIGDWGAHMTDNVAMLRQGVKALVPDAIIHLGDVYYSGTGFECTRNVLDVMQNLTEETGKRLPFFTIPGNHEYYSGGGGFYDMIGKINDPLPRCQQKASYFCLRTSGGAWQFLGMDTGINDHIPGKPVGPGLMPTEIAWHRDKLESFKGSTVLLSHHQLFSANSEINAGPRPYLNESLYSAFHPYFDRVAAWFWGHEHNFVAYKDGLLDLRKGRLLGCSAYEEAEDEGPYKIKYAEIGYAPGVPPLRLSTYTTLSKKFYNHAFALLEVHPDRIDISYYEYPSWDQDFSQPEPALEAPFYRETITATPAPAA